MSTTEPIFTAENHRDEGSLLPWTLTDGDLERQVLELLHRHYPDWTWRVESGGGIVAVRNLNLSSKHGFVLKTLDLATVADMKRAAILAGGEFLERYGFRRGRLDLDAYLSWIKAQPMGQFGPPPGGM